MKKIAIQGHQARGKDVIKILESLGGINKLNLEGNKSTGYYYLNRNNDIWCDYYFCVFKEYTCYTLEEYEQKFNNMEKRNIQIDLTTAKVWYNQGGQLKEIALQAFSEKELQNLPKSWKEYCEINPLLDIGKEFFLPIDGTPTAIPQKYSRYVYSFTMSSKKRAEQFVVLNKLLQIRDYYNQGWEPNWNDVKQEKFVIGFKYNKLFREVFYNLMFTFAFKTCELRNEFFNNFKEDLEFIKEFL